MKAHKRSKILYIVAAVALGGAVLLSMNFSSCNETGKDTGGNSGPGLTAEAQSLPEGISEITLTTPRGMIEGTTSSITLSIATGKTQGTATFTNTATEKNCELTLSFSEQQASDLNSKLKMLKYCNIESGSCASETVQSMSVKSSSVELGIDKYKHCAPTPYLCAGTDEFYDNLKTVIGANSGIGKCPSDWSSAI
jgi:hypothetical protein